MAARRSQEGREEGVKKVKKAAKKK